MHRLVSDRSKTNRRRATALLSAAALFLVVLLATGAQAGFGLDFFQATPDETLLESDGICPTPTETPSPIETEDPGAIDELEDPDCIDPDPTETPDDEDNNNNDGGGGGNNGGGNNGGDDGNGDGGGNGGTGNDGGNGGTGNDGNNKDGSGSGDKGGGDAKKSGDDKKDKEEVDLSDDSAPDPYKGKFNAEGEYDTDKLQFIASKLRARDVSEEEILEGVYPPFILGGPAAWTDTWGAPRYGPGPIVRTHEGQDVFCKYGDPVLATENGEVEFEDGGLGGRIARLHRGDGSYWYYAHLSDWNTKEFKNGDKVQEGDVIGYCGNTGNAISTPPHVHFGFYQKDGSAANPMGYLVGWLKDAEDRAARAYHRITGERIDLYDIVNSRLFGDGFAPDISELKVSSESLLASGSSPESGALGLAETALRAALAHEEDPAAGTDVGDVPLEAGGSAEGASPFDELVDAGSAASD
jgi:murein DD-endopeptidase MepM/ murein hydrolase activator NlpD